MAAINTPAPVVTGSSAQNNRFAFWILTSLFFMWGFITCLNDLLIPLLKSAFSLGYFGAMFTQFAFFGAYFIFSLVYFLISAATGDPIAKIGYQKGLVIGLVICAIGCAGFYPAAQFHIYPLFLTALFVLGCGVTMIQIAANPFATILGPPETASSRLNLSQGLNSLGYVIAPIIGGMLLFGSILGQKAGASAVVGPYLGLAAAFLLLAVVFFFVPLPSFTSNEPVQTGVRVFHHPHFVFGMAAIFFYVGGEVAVGSIIVNYLGLPEIMGYDHETASKFLSWYWGGLMIGRFMGAISLSGISSGTKKTLLMVLAGALATAVIYLATHKDWTHPGHAVLLTLGDILPYVGVVVLGLIFFVFAGSRPSLMVGLFSLAATALTLVALLTTGQISMWSLLAIGLFNSVMWSNIFSLSIEGLGKDTSQASSLLVMMIVGGALVPLLQGWLADVIGLKLSLIVVFACYGYLAFFGFVGYPLFRKKTI